jgi:ketosteroid isomerase-like protein
MADDEEAIIKTYTRYFTAFQRLDPRAIVAYYHAPRMLVSASGVAVMAGADEVEARFGQLMQELKARGYGRSELSELQVQRLDDRIAVVSISGARYRTDGSHLESLGATYTMRKTNAGWQIVVTMLHDPSSVPGQE